MVGRTPYDALAELFGLLGRALPWVVVLALALYTSIEVSKSYQDGQAAATKEFAARATELNKLQQTTFSQLEALRTSQLDGLGNFSKVNTSVMEAIARNQAALSAAREELVKERENQEAAASKVREAQRELEDAKRQQRDLEGTIGALERKVWAAEGAIDAADRLARFVAQPQQGAVSLDRRELSRRFENAQADAVSRDAEGALYYGPYRMPGGHMADFLKALARTFPTLASRLEQAGGAKAAAEGGDDFRYEWKSLSRDAEFMAAQDAFVETTKFDPFVERLRSHFRGKGVTFEPERRSEAFVAVIWSAAVQHGPGSNVVIRAFDGIDMSAATDGRLIGAIYTERKLIDRYFPNLNATAKTLLAARYVFEEELAMRMLKQTGEVAR